MVHLILRVVVYWETERLISPLRNGTFHPKGDSVLGNREGPSPLRNGTSHPKGGSITWQQRGPLSFTSHPKSDSVQRAPLPIEYKYIPHLLWIQVYIDGVLELTGASSSASVRVYSADADTRTLGSVFYRETTSPELLEVSSALFSAGFNATNFTSMFIATWFYVGYYDGGVDLVCVCVNVCMRVCTCAVCMCV